MNDIEAIEVIDSLLHPANLTAVQELVLRHVWHDQSYAVIAKSSGYDPDYIKTVGSRLWQILSETLGERVSKNNLKLVLRRHQQEQREQEGIAVRPALSQPLVDWGEATDLPHFWGRQTELQQVDQWINQEQVRLICISGLAGVGKSVLTLHIAEKRVERGQGLLWRTVRHAPSLLNLIRSYGNVLGLETLSRTTPDDLHESISRFIRFWREHRSLIVFDQWEQVLRDANAAKAAEYNHFLHRLVTERHQSTVLITSREIPAALDLYSVQGLSVRTLHLQGLPATELQTLCTHHHPCFGSVASWQEVTRRYSGNPLYGVMITQIVQKFFAGDLAAFLYHDLLLLAPMTALIEEQMNCLTSQEQSILYGLAVTEQSLSIERLEQQLAIPRLLPNWWADLRALRRRGLIEEQGSTYHLIPTIRAWLLNRLLDTLCLELQSHRYSFFNSYALMPRVPQWSTNLSLMTRLQLQWQANRERIISWDVLWQEWLSHWRHQGQQKPGYAASNLMHFGMALGVSMQGQDFSGLAIWNADLTQGDWQEVNFQMADLYRCHWRLPLGSLGVIAFSPQGNWLAIAGEDSGIVRLWQWPDYEDEQILVGHSSGVKALAFSPDGLWLISGSEDRTLRFWELDTGECVAVGSDPMHWIGTVAWSPNGQWVISGSNDGSVRFWDPAMGACVHTCTHHQGSVQSVAVSADSSWVASGSEDQTIALWTLPSAQYYVTLIGHTHGVTALAFTSTQGRIDSLPVILASGSRDSTIRLWDPQTGQELALLRGHTGGIQHLFFQDEWLVSSSDDGSIRRWEWTGWIDDALSQVPRRQPSTWIPPHHRLRGIALIPQSCQWISYGLDQTLRLWDPQQDHSIRCIQGEDRGTQAVVFASNDQIIASRGRVVYGWYWPRSESIPLDRVHVSPVSSLTYAGEWWASGSQDGTLCLGSLAQPQTTRHWQEHGGVIQCVALAPTVGLCASASRDGTVRLWHFTKGLQHVLNHGDAVWAVAFDPTAQMIVTGTQQGSLNIWNPWTGDLLSTWQAHKRPIMSVVWTEGYLASGGEDRSIIIWDAQRQQTNQVLTGHRARVRCLAAHGSLLASGSYDQTIRLWDPQTGQCRQMLTQHRGWIESLSFSPTGDYLASGSQDETVKIWQISTGQCLQTLQMPRPYEGMNIQDATGLSSLRRQHLQRLGAKS